MANKILAQLLELPIPEDQTRESLRFLGDELNSTDIGTEKFKKIKLKLIDLGIPEDTPDKYFGIVIENWYENFTEAPEYVAQTQTTVSEKANEDIFRDAEYREKTAKEARERAKTDVDRGIKKQQELYEQFFKGKKVVVVPTEEIPTVELTKEDKEKLFTASQEAKENPAGTRDFVKEKIVESVQSSSPEYQKGVTEPVIEKTAVSITENLRSTPDWKTPDEIPSKIPVMNPVSPIVALTMLEDAKLKGLITDEQARKMSVEMAQNFALGLEAENTINFAGANAVFGQNIAASFYGPADGHVTQFEIAENQEEQRDEGVELDLEGIYDNGKKFYDIWNKIRSGTTTTEEVVSTSLTYVPTYAQPIYATTAAKTTTVLAKALPIVGGVYGFRQGALLSQWARSGQPLISAGNQQMLRLLTSRAGIQEITSASMLTFSKPFVFQSGKLSLVFVTGANQATGAQVAMGGVKFGEKWLGLVGAKGGTQAVVGTVTAQAGTKIAVGTSSFLTKALTFLGGLGSWATAGLSFVAGWILGKIIEKIDWTKVKKFFKEVLGPLLLVGGGIMFGAPVLGLAAGGLAFGVARGATLAGIGAGIWGFFGAIGSAFIISISTPIIITLLVLPPLVAFIMLVINNSAYMVPPGPSSGSGGITSSYIEVIKTPNPPGPFENSELPLTVEYTITIKAKRGNLTNVRISYSCNVTSETSEIKCPKPEPDIPTTIEGEISPTSPSSFTYKHTYSAGVFEDSLITDTIIVTADTPTIKNEKASGSASITIGDPPDECPNEMWPTDHGLFISQGAYSPGGFTHSSSEAIDIGVAYASVYAIHSGTVVRSNFDSCYGNIVEIKSRCDNKDFISRYSHLEALNVKIDQEVTKGNTIGLSGKTGSCVYGLTGLHLHFEFKYWPDGKPSWPNNPPFMMKPYIPTDVPRGCSSIGECNVSY